MNPVIQYTISSPPIIYLIDGNLTTSLPEKVEVRKMEEFGLSLRSFQNKPYRFKMRGFSNTALFRGYGARNQGQATQSQDKNGTRSTLPD